MKNICHISATVLTMIRGTFREDGGLVMRCKRCGKAKRTSKFFSDDQICGQCRIERNGDYTAKKSARAKKAYEAWKASGGKQDWRELRKQRKQQDERFVP